MEEDTTMTLDSSNPALGTFPKILEKKDHKLAES